MTAGEISKPDTCCPKIREYCTPPTDDPCPYASDDMCDVELGYCDEGSDLIDCGAALMLAHAVCPLFLFHSSLFSFFSLRSCGAGHFDVLCYGSYPILSACQVRGG
jgi:hypothetical protein